MKESGAGPKSAADGGEGLSGLARHGRYGGLLSGDIWIPRPAGGREGPQGLAVLSRRRPSRKSTIWMSLAPCWRTRVNGFPEPFAGLLEFTDFAVAFRYDAFPDLECDVDRHNYPIERVAGLLKHVQNVLAGALPLDSDSTRGHGIPPCLLRPSGAALIIAATIMRF